MIDYKKFVGSAAETLREEKNAYLVGNFSPLSLESISYLTEFDQYCKDHQQTGIVLVRESYPLSCGESIYFLRKFCGESLTFSVAPLQKQLKEVVINESNSLRFGTIGRSITYARNNDLDGFSIQYPNAIRYLDIKELFLTTRRALNRTRN